MTTRPFRALDEVDRPCPHRTFQPLLPYFLCNQRDVEGASGGDNCTAKGGAVSMRSHLYLSDAPNGPPAAWGIGPWPACLQSETFWSPSPFQITKPVRPAAGSDAAGRGRGPPRRPHGAPGGDSGHHPAVSSLLLDGSTPSAGVQLYPAPVGHPGGPRASGGAASAGSRQFTSAVGARGPRRGPWGPW